MLEMTKRTLEGKTEKEHIEMTTRECAIYVVICAVMIKKGKTGEVYKQNRKK